MLIFSLYNKVKNVGEKMIDLLSKFFKEECIEFYGVLPIEECKIQKEYLFKELAPKSVICFLAPYYTENGEYICYDANIFTDKI